VETPKSEEPAARRYHTGVLYQKSLYVFGGTGGGKEARNDLYQLDSGKWSQVKPTTVPPERFAHVAVVHGNKMYIHGGNGGMGFLAKDDLFCCDFKLNTWESVTSPGGPCARYHHSATTDAGHMYIFGGCKTNKEYLNDLYSFDFETREWKEMKPTVPSSLLPRAGHTVFCLHNKLYLYGGFGGDGGYDTYQDMYMLDLENPKEWTPVQLSAKEPSDVPPSGRPISCATTLKYAYIFGGSTDGKKAAGKMFRFDPKEAKFLQVPLWLQFDINHIASTVTGSKGLEPVPRYGHCSAVDGDCLTIFGGTGSMYLSDTIQIILHE